MALHFRHPASLVQLAVGARVGKISRPPTNGFSANSAILFLVSAMIGPPFRRRNTFSGELPGNTPSSG
jgi:hypothetical protein